MRGILVAGGRGTRLSPLTEPLSKEMLPVYNKPMIFYAVDAMLSGGINEIGVIVHRSTIGLYRKMLSGYKGHCSFTYFAENERRGPGWALLSAKEWIGENDFALILGDSLFFDPLPLLSKEHAPHLFVVEMLEDEDDLRKYGQVRVVDGRVTEMRWKPDEVFSHLVQTTVFVFPPDVFDRVRLIYRLRKPKEIHISDITSQYIAEGRMGCTILNRRSYIDCGTFEALFQASVRMRSRALGR